MILTIYLVLLGISLLFITLGLFTNNVILNVTGGGLLIVLGAALMINGFEYKTGTTKTTNYTYTNTTLTSTQETQTYTNTNYTDKTFGIFLMLVGFAAFFLSLLDEWRNRQ